MKQSAQKSAQARLRELLPFGLAIFLIVSVASHFSEVLVRLESHTKDTLTKYGRRNPERNDLAFVAIDPASQSLDQLFPEDLEASPALTLMQREWPWPRNVHAMAAERLLQAGAKIVVIDLVFPGPKEGDQELGAMLDRYPGRIILGAFFDRKQHVLGNGETQEMWSINEPPRTILPKGAANDLRIGYVNFWNLPGDPIRTARFRTSLSYLEYGEHHEGDPLWYSLSARVLQNLGQASAIPEGFHAHPFRYSKIDAAFSRPYSYYMLFVPDLWKHTLRNGEVFKDKIVIIGPYGEVFHDYHHTPIGRISGPEVHLHTIAAALNHEFYRYAGWGIGLLLNAAGAFLALLLASKFARPILGLLALFGGVAAYLVLAWGTFNWGNLLLPILPPLLAFYCTGLFSLAYQFALERIARARMRRMLDRYVSRNVVQELVDNPEFLASLGGSRKCVTVLFSDVRGFTSMSEAADPVALVNQLNEYFASMVDIVFEHGGSLDKFIGDAVMARWGDLQTDGPALDARSAVLAALQMRKELARLNEKWTGEGRGQLSFGVGVHQGDAIFGNIGSEKKMEITVIGDAVNVGSRLEGLSKHYKCDLLVSESIAQHVRDEVVLRFVDLVRPPGKRTPVEIHHAIGRRDEVDPVFVKWLDEYHQAIALYRSREYGAAASEFSRLLQERTGDALCALYIERCQRFEKDPPPADWDGAETRKEK